MKLGIKVKLVAFISFTLIFVISIFGIVSLIGIKNYQDKQNEAALFNQKNLYEQYLNEYLKTQVIYKNSYNSDFYLRRADMFNEPWLQSVPSSIYSVQGSLLSSFGKISGNINQKKHNELMKYAKKGNIAYAEIGDTIYYFSPLKYNNKTVAILELNYNVKISNELYKGIKTLFLIAGALALGVGIFISAIYFSKLTRDLHKLNESIRNIKNGFFNKINKLKRKDELGILSSDIAYMSSTIDNNLKDLEQEKNNLSIACEKLKKMSREQKEFIGNVTHEFKTPITSIKAYADLMQLYDYDEALDKDASESISKECERLTIMVDKILNLSSLEKYDFELNKKEVQLRGLLEQISFRIIGKIKKNNLNLKMNLDDINIMADEENLRYIFINIIDNAIKYNKPNGQILINAFKEEKKAVIEFSDTGIGICKNELDKIFEPFYRVKSDRSRISGGTGLGLSLVKKLVEKQEGEIFVRSEENVGSSFIIKFPLMILNDSIKRNSLQYCDKYADNM